MRPWYSVAILVLGTLISHAQSAAPHPRTPWGDPDLQGYYTNKYEYGTPFERPAAFVGRRVDEVSGKELADLASKRQQEALDRAPFFGGDPLGKIGNSAEFRDIYEVTRGSRAWLVTDPADGKIPPIVPEARSRVQDAGRGGSLWIFVPPARAPGASVGPSPPSAPPLRITTFRMSSAPRASRAARTNS